MADLKQLKIMRDGDFDQKDPITELTRIMGLPPRSGPGADDFDDFGIDLEAELLGAFETEMRPPLQAANAVVPMRGLSRVDTAREPDERAAPAVFPASAPEPEPALDASAHDELEAFEFADDAFSRSGAMTEEPAAAFEEPAAAFDAPTPRAGETAAEAASEEPKPAISHAPETLAPVAFLGDTPSDEPAFAAEPQAFDLASFEQAGYEPATHEAGNEEPAAAYEPEAYETAAYEPVRFAPVADDGPAFEPDTSQPGTFAPEAFEPASSADTFDAPDLWAAPEPDMSNEPDHAFAPAIEDEPMATVDAQPDDFGDLDMSELADAFSPVTDAPPPVAPAAASGPIFDPFAELAAMAALSSDRVRSQGQAREVPPAMPFVAPAAAEAPPPPVSKPEPTRFYSRANIAAPAAATPREFPRAAAPVEAPAAPLPVSQPAIPEQAALAPRPVTEMPVADMPDAGMPVAAADDTHLDINRALDDMIGAYTAPAAKPAPVVAPAEDDLGGDPLAFDEAAFEAALEADGFDDLAFDDDQDEQPALAAEMEAFEPDTDVQPEREAEPEPVAEQRPRFLSSAPFTAPPAAAVAVAATPAVTSAAEWSDEPIDDLDRVLDDMLGAFGDLDEGHVDASLDQALAADDWAMLDRGPAAWGGEAEPEAVASEPMSPPVADARAEDRSSQAVPASAFEFDGPDLETVEVPEYGVEPADELDIPDLSFEDDLPVATQPDELELQFASAFADLNDTPTLPSHGQPSYGMAAAATAATAVAATAAMRGQGASRIDDYGQPAGYDAAEVGYRQATRPSHDALARDWQAGQGYETADPNLGDWPQEEYDVAPLDDGEVASAFHGAAEAPRQARAGSRRRGLLVAGLVAGVAVVGGIAAFAFTRGGGDGVPVLVRADPEPVKVRPETPGGVTVPNQDKAVYDRVAGAQNEEPPTQETLVSAREEPVELNVRDVTPFSEGVADEEMLAPAPGKAEDRVEAAIDDEFQAPADETPVVAPRRVRTMVVRADGTLVPREEAPEVAEAPAPTSPTELARPLAAPLSGEAAPLAEATDPVETAELTEAPSAAEPAPGEQPPVRRVETTTITPESAAAAQRMPDRGPVAPTRPAEQPVDIVGNTTRAAAPTQVAAAAPVAAAAAPVSATPTSEWAMQIASQPSPEGAQASYADLARRHAAILGGRGVNIVKADIAGRGTFWRVRIPAETRAEAISLCERYKAAGGSCFVAR